MKYLTEFRDPQTASAVAGRIRRITKHAWRIMEVCGGQTHTIVKSGLEQLLPAQVTLIHGPGCPVCVTPAAMVDRAVEISMRPEVVFCSFGDMMRVPGSSRSLLNAKSRGADVRMVYSPLDCLMLAEQNPQREVVFFAVGFETTAPANAMLASQAEKRGLRNLSLLVSHVLVPPALEAMLQAENHRIHAFLAAGHVCTVMGYREYEPIAARYRVPVVVAGFEPLDLLEAIRMAVAQLEEGRAEVENQYARAVRAEGNVHAQALIREVFEVRPREWRGIGEIPSSGLRLRPPYAWLDAELRFPGSALRTTPSDNGCIAGQILQGFRRPQECPSFGARCTPESPLGAPMVSSEGACAAYYSYGRQS